MSQEQTTVQTVDMDLDSILNMGADNIMLPSGNEPVKPNIFNRKGLDVDPIRDIKADPDPDPNPNPTPTATTTQAADPNPDPDPLASHQALDNLIEEEAEKGQGGRPKIDKQGMSELMNKLIEKKLIVPFDDPKPLNEYSLKDYEELLEANFQERERKVRDEIPAEFFQSLPPELQYAAKYVADGGQDLRGLFRTLASVEEVKSLDTSSVAGQKQIVRSYLQATNSDWSPEEIEEEVTAWEDRGELEAKANKFKPKLDAMSEKQVQYKLQKQEQMRKQQEEHAQYYMDSVYKTLEPAELNGLKLDKKTQNLLFTGLIQPNYQSVSGNQTNLLGHLLEKYQFVEPNHGLVAEALWLLADPEGYRAKVREVQKKEVVTDTVRKLKIEQSNRTASHNQLDEEESTGSRSTPRIPRPTSIFKR